MAPDFFRLADPDLQNYIFDNANEDVRNLVLRHKFIHGVPVALVAAQIAARRNSKDKLPSFYKTRGIIYPPTTNLEQSSSELASRFKAAFVADFLVAKHKGLDLTGGFGIDSLYLSLMCENFEYVERELSLLETACHNHALAGATTIQYHHATSEDFIRKSTDKFDFVFIDPSRRSASRKVFRFKDCEPDLLSLLPVIFEKTDRLLVKSSPLMDLQQGVIELTQVEKIVVLAIDNECKEVLFWCTKNFNAEPIITCVNLSTQKTGTQYEFEFTFLKEKSANSNFSNPLTYLYEPNASILKAGAFKTIGAAFDVSKLQVNTHLYTSGQYRKEFPGRIFKIKALNPGSKEIKNSFSDGKVNVMTRNYPLTADQLKRKYRLHDGGEKYLIGFSGAKQKFLAVAERLQ